MTPFRHIAVFAAVGLLIATPAMADAIDGDWCGPDGRTMTIHGPSIRIPSGAEISGDYTRHTFNYVGPAGDPEDGQDVRMRIFSDDDMDLQRIINGDAQPAERWHRCKPIA